jgi:hypothetical protein
MEYDFDEGYDFEPFATFRTATETKEWLQAWLSNDSVDDISSTFRVFGEDGTGGCAW